MTPGKHDEPLFTEAEERRIERAELAESGRHHPIRDDRSWLVEQDGYERWLDEIGSR